MPKRHMLAFIVTIEIYSYSKLFRRNIDSFIQNNGIQKWWIAFPERLSWGKVSGVIRVMVVAIKWRLSEAWVSSGLYGREGITHEYREGTCIRVVPALLQSLTLFSPVFGERSFHPLQVTEFCVLGWQGCLITSNKDSYTLNNALLMWQTEFICSILCYSGELSRSSEASGCRWPCGESWLFHFC